MAFRMSKELAGRIATALLVKKKLQIQKLEKQFDVELITEYILQLPKEVVKVNREFPMYIHSAMDLTFSIVGMPHNIYVQAAKRLPYRANDSICLIQGDRATHFVKLRNAFKFLGNEYDKLHNETVAALMGLGTLPRIAKDFPEAVPFIPVSTSQALQINLPDLREKIK